MKRNAQVFAGFLVGVVALFIAVSSASAAQEVIRYARFRIGQTVAYGIVEGDRVRQITGAPFDDWQKTDTTYALTEVQLLVPSEPSTVVALAGNYKSHLGDKQAPAHPDAFFKPVSCLLQTGGDIVLPKAAAKVDYEAEMVIVVGKRAKDVPVAQALDYVLGVTCGNDVSARDWQKNDVQWWRAKGTDTFGPCGPFIAAGIDYDNLELQLRVNGEVKQHARTKDLIHGVAEAISWISQHVTLEPGDLIYTGTSGTTSALKPGDTVEVELEGVGVLRNNVVAAR